MLCSVKSQDVQEGAAYLGNTFKMIFTDEPWVVFL